MPFAIVSQRFVLLGLPQSIPAVVASGVLSSRSTLIVIADANDGITRPSASTAKVHISRRTAPPVPLRQVLTDIPSPHRDSVAPTYGLPCPLLPCPGHSDPNWGQAIALPPTCGNGIGDSRPRPRARALRRPRRSWRGPT